MFDRLKLGFKMYKPEIETGLGLGFTICGAIEACLRSRRTTNVVDDFDCKMYNLDLAIEDGDIITKDECRKEKATIYAHTGLELAKIYAVPGVIFGTGLGLMLKSNSDYKSKVANLSLAYSAVSEAYRQYRKRVIDRYGKDVDDDIRFDIQHKKVSEKVTDEDGKTKTKKKDVKTIGNPFLMNPYTYIWDYASSFEFDPNDEFWNKSFLSHQMEYWNDVIKTRAKISNGKPGWVFLNEVLTTLGMDPNMNGGGQEVGWLYYPNGDNPNGDNHIDFGLLESYRDPNGDLCFINENSINLNEPVWLLDFNCQGNILEILKQYD